MSEPRKYSLAELAEAAELKYHIVQKCRAAHLSGRTFPGRGAGKLAAYMLENGIEWDDVISQRGKKSNHTMEIPPLTRPNDFEEPDEMDEAAQKILAIATRSGDERVAEPAQTPPVPIGGNELLDADPVTASEEDIDMPELLPFPQKNKELAAKEELFSDDWDPSEPQKAEPRQKASHKRQKKEAEHNHVLIIRTRNPLIDCTLEELLDELKRRRPSAEVVLR